MAAGVVTVPAGSYLFHGTLESFSSKLSPGGDGLIWFADTPKIAQLYIPHSGGVLYTGPEQLKRPTESAAVRELQKKLGIEYNYDEVEWENHRLVSYPLPRGWTHFPSDRDVEELLKKAGYESKGHGVYPVRMHSGRILEPDEVIQGRLYIAKIREPLILWSKATGESDLMDLQYHDIKTFNDAKKKGLDGVLIDDFAQSEEYGNFGHLSVGLFDTDKLDVKNKPAQYREWDYQAKGTPEYPNPPPMYLHKL